jgi:hypothetical protein
MSMENVYTGVEQAKDAMGKSANAVTAATKDTYTINKKAYGLTGGIDKEARRTTWGLSFHNMKAKYDEVVGHFQKAQASSRETMDLFTGLAGGSNNPNAQNIFIYGGMAALQLAGENQVGDVTIPTVIREIGEDIAFIQERMEAIKHLGNVVAEQAGIVHGALNTIQGAQEEARRAMKDYLSDIS